MRKTLLVFFAFVVSVSAGAQTGGGFNLEQNVIGNGGWRSDGGGFTVLGTMGQSNSGSPTSGGGFHIIDGLWAIENLTASSPLANVSGRVTKGKGEGIPEVLVTARNLTTGQVFQVRSEAHGEYVLADIPVGYSYVITALHNHFQFQPATVFLFVSQDRTGVDFPATP